MQVWGFLSKYMVVAIQINGVCDLLVVVDPSTNPKFPITPFHSISSLVPTKFHSNKTVPDARKSIDLPGV
jgi:hypothetical protein